MSANISRSAEIISEIKNNSSIYFDAYAIVELLEKFAPRGINEILDKAVKELTEIAEANYRENAFLFSEFKQLKN